MFRPTRLVFPFLLAALTLALAGCGTIYDDMYSPRRSRFVPPKPKATIAPIDELPPVDAAPVILPPPATLDPAPLDPAAPPVAPDALGIPGMEPMPAVPGMEPVPAIPNL